MNSADAFHTIDLNCDLGESYGTYTIGNDEQIMPYISSANIACGFHGGDPTVMKRTVKLCMLHGVALGAHPGLPDLSGFGRRAMAISAEEAFDIVLYQIGALAAFVKAEGGRLNHVKPHGALYHMTMEDESLSIAVAEAIYKADPDLIVYGYPGSSLLKAGQRLGLRCANEAFIDRMYRSDGSLLPRSEPQAVITDLGQATEQARDIVINKRVKSCTGELLPLQAETLCIHGDSSRALEMAEAIRELFVQEGILAQAL